MDFRAELAEAEHEPAKARHARIVRVMIELALAHPDRIEGQRAGDWGPVFAALLARLTRHARRNALQSLSLLPRIPASLAPALIDAGAVDLLERTVLTPHELRALARKAATDQLTTLAERPDLPADAANVVVARGDLRAQSALAANHSARIGLSCFGTLAELAYSDRRLSEALVARPDLPPAILERLWPYLSDAGKRAAIAAAPHQVSQRLAALMGESAATSAASAMSPATAVGAAA